MSLPSQEQTSKVAQVGAAAMQTELAALGVNIGADQIAQGLQWFVDGMCAQAWREVQAAGKAAETTTTLQQAEVDQGSTPQ